MALTPWSGEDCDSSRTPSSPGHHPALARALRAHRAQSITPLPVPFHPPYTHLSAWVPSPSPPAPPGPRHSLSQTVRPSAEDLHLKCPNSRLVLNYLLGAINTPLKHTVECFPIAATLCPSPPLFIHHLLFSPSLSPTRQRVLGMHRASGSELRTIYLLYEYLYSICLSAQHAARGF